MAFLKRIDIQQIDPAFLRGLKGDTGDQGATGIGIPGTDGRDGKDGIGTDGEDGRDGIDGVSIRGDQGATGPAGAVPEHEVRNGEIRFMHPDGSWGDWVKVTGSSGGGGKISENTYTPVTTAEYHVNRSQLDLGTNIFGVNFDGDVTIFLPNTIDPRSIIVVNDESGNASANNITITVEN